MTNRWPIILLIPAGLGLALLAGWLEVGVALAEGEAWPAEVVRVYDGDTVQVRQEGSGELVKVRLWGVDCHETRNARADEETRFTRALTLGRRVWVAAREKDRYGRTVAEIWLNRARTISLSEELLWFGWAKWSRKYAPGVGRFESAEAEAKKRKRGIW